MYLLKTSLEYNPILISSFVPAESTSAVCSTIFFNLVSMAESKVENVRQSIKMNLRNIINQGFTTCHKSNFNLIYGILGVEQLDLATRLDSKQVSIMSAPNLKL